MVAEELRQHVSIITLPPFNRANGFFVPPSCVISFLRLPLLGMLRNWKFAAVYAVSSESSGLANIKRGKSFGERIPYGSKQCRTHRTPSV